jgi:hypothetical protein
LECQLRWTVSGHPFAVGDDSKAVGAQGAQQHAQVVATNVMTLQLCGTRAVAVK